jgi:hypothetical protein
LSLLTNTLTTEAIILSACSSCSFEQTTESEDGGQKEHDDYNQGLDSVCMAWKEVQDSLGYIGCTRSNKRVGWRTLCQIHSIEVVFQQNPQLKAVR